MRVISNQKRSNSILSIKKNEREGIYNWGLDNGHPQLVEDLLKISVTAKACSDKVAKSIYGRSFGREYNSIILNKKGQNINDILRTAAREYAKFKNVFILVNYNLNYEIVHIEVLPTRNVRVGKTDTGGYTGTYKVSRDWTDRAAHIMEYHSYNPLETVIEKQIGEKGIEAYKGQILHIQEDTNAVYSASDIDVVVREAVIQHNSQEFRLSGSEEGFLNAKILAVKPFENEEKKSQFLRSLNNSRGSSNGSSVIVLESSMDSDDLKDQLHLQDLTSPYNDELFAYSDEQAKRSIAEAFGVPSILVGDSTEAVFGNSGEMLRVAEEQLWNSREEERDLIGDTINSLLEKYKGQPLKGTELQIKSRTQ